jgi:hypothetical protein
MLHQPVDQDITLTYPDFRCKGKIYLAVMEWKLLIFSQKALKLLVVRFMRSQVHRFTSSSV